VNSIDLLRICANKSLMGHTFAAAGGVDELAAVRAMVSGQTPRVNGYDPAYHDPRISNELQRSVQISRGGPFAVRGTLTTSMGLGGHYAARTATPFPQEMEAAVATLRQWNFSENDISHFRQQAPANRAAAHARYRALRSGQMKARQVYETSRFVRR